MFNTLSPELSTFLLVLACAFTVFSVIVLVKVRRLARQCRSACDYLLNQNRNDLGLRRLAEVEGTLTELLDSYDSLLKSHKKLRSRIGMRETRARRNGAGSDDDLSSGTDKTALRIAAKSAGLLK